jgi:DNA-directed RNA polymerase specialized sigma24 family protein
MQSEDEEIEKVTRHFITIDAMSLLETDCPQPSAEEIAEGERTYKEIIRILPTDRERFIAMSLGNGFDQVDVAFMLKVHPSQVSRAIRRIRSTLKSFV